MLIHDFSYNYNLHKYSLTQYIPIPTCTYSGFHIEMNLSLSLVTAFGQFLSRTFPTTHQFHPGEIWERTQKVQVFKYFFKTAMLLIVSIVAFITHQRTCVCVCQCTFKSNVINSIIRVKKLPRVQTQDINHR